jgi:hypothetical protein
MDKLELGVDKVDITPQVPIPLAGFAHRLGPYELVVRPIYARILAFVQKESQGNVQQALVISTDLIWWGSDRIPSLKKRIREQWGITESSILFHGTHSHSGPQTSTCFTESLGQPSLSYIEYLEEQVLNGIERAFQNREPVLAESQKGSCQIGIHRRKWIDGSIQMAPNSEGPVDPELTVIRFRTDSSRTKALLVHYTCHPTTTGDPYLSSEFTGFAMEQIESHMEEPVLAAFLQGCCGDIRPALIQDDSFYRGTDEDVKCLGNTLAEKVLNLLQKPMETHNPLLKTGKMCTVPLRFESVHRIEELLDKAKEPGIVGEWAKGQLVQPGKRVELEMTYLSITDRLSLLSFNSEMVVEYGFFIKEQFPGVLPLPYTNGMIGYIPTKQQLAEGGYESVDSAPYFGLPGCFDPKIEEDIKEQITCLIGEE